MRPLPAGDNWEPSLPDADRQRYAAAWQEFRCCRDCRHWSCDEGDDVGGCDTVRYAALLTPEDYTCDQFTKRD